MARRRQRATTATLPMVAAVPSPQTIMVAHSESVAPLSLKLPCIPTICRLLLIAVALEPVIVGNRRTKSTATYPLATLGPDTRPSASAPPRHPHAWRDHGVLATARNRKEADEAENGSSRHGSTDLANGGRRTALVRLNQGVGRDSGKISPPPLSAAGTNAKSARTKESLRHRRYDAAASTTTQSAF